jgi:hypothetical protein
LTRAGAPAGKRILTLKENSMKPIHTILTLATLALTTARHGGENHRRSAKGNR